MTPSSSHLKSELPLVSNDPLCPAVRGADQSTSDDPFGEVLGVSNSKQQLFGNVINLNVSVATISVISKRRAVFVLFINVVVLDSHCMFAFIYVVLLLFFVVRQFILYLNQSARLNKFVARLWMTMLLDNIHILVWRGDYTNESPKCRCNHSSCWHFTNFIIFIAFCHQIIITPTSIIWIINQIFALIIIHALRSIESILFWLPRIIYLNTLILLLGRYRKLIDTH